MKDTWQRFIATLASYSPALVARLNPGTDDVTIQKAEQRLGVLFTEEVKAFFRLQNGSNGPLFGSWAFLSLEEMCDDWLAMKEKMPFPVQPGDEAYYAWNENWLPLLRANSSLRLYIRIDPRDKEEEEDTLSAHEQSFIFGYGSIPYERLATLFLSTSRADFVAASINEFLENLIRSLEQKEYVYDKNIQGLRTLTGISSRLLCINEPSLYELDADFPDVNLSFGDRVAYPGLCCLPSRKDYPEQFFLIDQHTVAQSWELFRTSIEQIAPEMIKDLGIGISIVDLQRVEEQMQVRLPDDVKEWYSLCSGTTMMGEEERQCTIDFWHWYPLEYLYQAWNLRQELDGSPCRQITGKYLISADPRIQRVWWHPQWIPFMYHEDGCMLCIDLAPTSQGNVGQIILLIHKGVLYGHRLDIRRIPPVVWIAPDLGRFLAVFAQDLAKGKYTFDKESKILWSREGLVYVEEDEGLRLHLVHRRNELQGKNRQQEDLQNWQAFLNDDIPISWDTHMFDKVLSELRTQKRLSGS